METSVLIASDEAAFTKKAAQLVLEIAVKNVNESKRFTLVLSGGSTPKQLLSTLAEPYFRDRFPWLQTYVFWGDERCVSPDHPESNYKMAHDVLLSRIPFFPKDHIVRMKGEMQPPQEAAKAYENEIKAFFRLEKTIPSFDLIILGIGEDGHIASLFPGSESLKEKLKWVLAVPGPGSAPMRISLGLPVINNARKILFLAAGDSKAAIVREVLREDEVGARFPAELVRPVKGDLIWLLDKTSASKLMSEAKQKATYV